MKLWSFISAFRHFASQIKYSSAYHTGLQLLKANFAFDNRDTYQVFCSIQIIGTNYTFTRN